MIEHSETTSLTPEWGDDQPSRTLATLSGTVKEIHPSK